MEIPKELIENYISRRADDIELLKKSLEQNSVNEFHRIGHQILGNARNFGFTELEPLASKLESIQEKDLPNQGPGLIKAFSDWLSQKRSRS